MVEIASEKLCHTMLQIWKNNNIFKHNVLADDKVITSRTVGHA